MANYPNTPFTAGDDWTPEMAYLAFNQVFDDQTQYLGHRPRITDTELSDTAGQIKQRVAAIEDSLRVSVSSGLSLAYNSGSVRLPDGSILSVAGGLIATPDSSTSYVYLDQTGAIFCTTLPPVVRLLLAKVVTVSGAVSSVQDLRHIAQRPILPITSAIKTFGGSNTTDKVASNNEVFDQGYYYFRDFTVPSGITITIDKFAKIYCSGKVNIAGTVQVSAAAGGARGYSTGALAGVNQGGGSGSGAGGGSGSGGGTPYNFAAQPYGSGGGLGFIQGSGGSAAIGNGGDGGGGLWLEASGTITVTGSIFARGADALAPFSVVGTPSVSGAGGGSGGLILLSSLTSVTVSGTLDVRGGTGVSGINGGRGGGGGGGGFIVLMSPANNSTGSSLLLTGGNKGTDSGTSPGGGSGGGFGGAGGVSNGSQGRLILLNFVPIGS